MLAVLLLATTGPRDTVPYRPPYPRLTPAVSRWGAWERGQRLGLAVAERYEAGMYLDVLLSSEQADPNSAPYVRFKLVEFSGRPSPYRLELSGPTGPMPVTASGGYSSGANGNSSWLRLRPATMGDGWPYFPPGRYRLTATLDAPRDHFDPIGWVGRLSAPPVEFEVAAGPRRGFTPAEALAVLTDFVSPDPEARRSAVARVEVDWQRDAGPAAVGGLFGPAEAFRGRFTVDAAVAQLWYDDDWQDALRRAGPDAVGPLIACDRSPATVGLRVAAARWLALPGPDPRAFAHLTRLAETRDGTVGVLHALERLGPDAVPVLARIARDVRQHPTTRGPAVAALEATGTVETVGPVLADALRSDWPGLQYSAAEVAGRMGCRAVLPELRRLATAAVPADGSFDLRRDRHNTQPAALQAFARLGGEPGLVRAALDAPNTRGKAAFLLGAVGDGSDVPRLLRLLDDPEWYIRAQADVGLRGLADKPEGVGFDAADRREPKRWADWFAAHPPR